MKYINQDIHVIKDAECPFSSDAGHIIRTKEIAIYLKLLSELTLCVRKSDHLLPTLRLGTLALVEK